MYAYCNNNPVNMRDDNGERALQVAFDLLDYWIFGRGENLYYDGNSSIAKKMKKSNTMETVIEKAIEKFESGEEYGIGTVTFEKSEPDLWLGVRNATYEISIEKETKETGFWLFKQTKTRYVVEIKVFDIYDFNIGNEKGDGIGSLLNNIGYWAQERNLGTEYYWEVNYVYKTKWK